MDFSSDHTLVADSRFPYLVNMYKDYAAGGGQGIETIPGFRRLFVAPNGGRIHGIHSYKDNSGKRHVLVHAGKELYNWGNFPKEAGFAKEIVAVVEEYDEYSSIIEGVGIKDDYVMLTITGDYIEGMIVDVRCISFLDTNIKVSIYPKDLNGESSNTIYVPDAYSFYQSDDGSNYTVTVKISKKIIDVEGTLLRSINAGDTVKVSCCIFEEAREYSKHGNPTRASIGKTKNNEQIITLTYKVDPLDAAKNYLPIQYGCDNEYYTDLLEENLPDSLKGYASNETGVKRVVEIYSDSGEMYDPFVIIKGAIFGTSVQLAVRLTVLYEGDEENVNNISSDKFYQRDSNGEKVELPSEMLESITWKTVAYTEQSSRSFTATETDYNCVDISDASGLEVSGVYLKNGTEISSEKYRREGDILLFAKCDLEIGKSVTVLFGKTEIASARADMNEHDSTSFVFGNKLYILDGKNYLVYDGESVSPVLDDAYVPTTRINIVVGGENSDAGKEHEPRNILSPFFKNTFVPDGASTEYYLSENNIESVSEVKVYGEVLEETEYDVDLINGKVTFKSAPKRSENVEGYPEAYAGVEITAEKGVYPDIGDKPENGDFRSMINKATLATVFDNRVFFSGIPEKPNFILWSNLKDPSYIGILNYQQDGVGTSPITAMIPVANTLLVLKGDTEDGGSVFYHTPVETGIDVMTKSYPSEEGIAGIGCLGAACNFLDDPVFISRLGLEAVGKLNLSYERSREHRSSLIDAKLVNLPDLAFAKLCEWAGYLVLLVDGKIFLADSRQRYADQTGIMQYEWYYLEDIGVFEGQDKRYEYLREFPKILMDGENRRDVTVLYNGLEYTAELITDVLPDIELIEVGEKTEKVIATVNVDELTFDIAAAMYSENGKYRACLCSTDDEMIGGTFCPAVIIKNIDDNLFFGTTNGVVCSFNFDQRGSDGAIPADYYTFDGRRIYSGCALKMDNCGIPHMTKTTVKKSTVVKVKSFMRTAAKVRVRTNRNPFNEIARINGTRFSFDDMDFSDFSFIDGEDTLFSIREKEKKWIEKQYYLYSDEYKKPFALYYLAYRYFVAGKYKG